MATVAGFDLRLFYLLLCGCFTLVLLLWLLLLTAPAASMRALGDYKTTAAAAVVVLRKLLPLLLLQALLLPCYFPSLHLPSDPYFRGSSIVISGPRKRPEAPLHSTLPLFI